MSMDGLLLRFSSTLGLCIVDYNEDLRNKLIS